MAESSRDIDARVARFQHHSSLGRSTSDDWQRGYDETVRRGPPLDTSVSTGRYEPGADTLAPAGVHGVGDPDTAERWGHGEITETGVVGTSGDYAPTYNMPQEPGSEGGWGRVGSSTSGDNAYQRPRGPKGYRRSDDRICEDICEHLMDLGSIDVSDVEVRVRDGCVVLEGTVPERAMKHAIEDIAATTLGVQDVENRIRVPRVLPNDGR
jgi:hypothetical protein